MDCSLPGSSIHGILQVRVLQWGAIAFSVSRSVLSNSLQSHGLYSLPGSSVHGIFQARVLEWVAIAFSAIDMNLSKFWEMVEDREAWHAAVHGVKKSDMTE